MIDLYNPNAAPKPVSARLPILGKLVPDPGGLTIDYELSLDDYVAFSIHHHLQSPTARAARRRVWVLLLFVLLAAAAILWLQIGANPGMWPVAAGGLAVVLLACAVAPYRYKVRLRQQVQRLYQEGRSDRLIGARRVTLSPDHLFYATPHTQTLTTWAGVERVVPTENGLYIYLTAVSGVIIPRRAFAGDAQFHQWTELAAAHHAKAAV